MSNFSFPSFGDILSSLGIGGSEASSGLNTGTGSTLAPTTPMSAIDANNIPFSSVPSPSSSGNSFTPIQPQQAAPIVDLPGVGSSPSKSPLSMQSLNITPSSTSTSSLSSLSGVKEGDNGVLQMLQGILGDTSGVRETLSLGKEGAVNKLLPPDTSSIPSSLISFAKDNSGKTIMLFKGKPITGSGSSFGGM